MTTLLDLIDHTQRRLQPRNRGIFVTLDAPVSADATTLSYTDNSVNGNAGNSILVGSTLSVDLELYLVTAPPSGGSISVNPGYRSSTSTSHNTGALIYIDPQYSDFDIQTAINHDLDDISSPQIGLYTVASEEISYNPVFAGYDLGTLTNFVDIIAIRYKTALPDRYQPPIKRWELIPGIVDPAFPSGTALFIHEDGWPGLPLSIIYRAGFSHLHNYTDDVQLVAGLAPTMHDIPPLGAVIALVISREIKRNSLSAQPDSRLAPEVPAGAIGQSVAGIRLQRAGRIADESARLKRQTQHLRRRY